MCVLHVVLFGFDHVSNIGRMFPAVRSAFTKFKMLSLTTAEGMDFGIAWCRREKSLPTCTDMCTCSLLWPAGEEQARLLPLVVKWFKPIRVTYSSL